MKIKWLVEYTLFGKRIAKEVLYFQVKVYSMHLQNILTQLSHSNLTRVYDFQRLLAFISCHLTII